ncbi:hypothetical protein QJS10_CPA05g00391 [Acorus calamus]|uniref:Uncharacterized protein n=1 Tax=Acorus calamus TaxID=4465 RepID=A0AAV9EU02_ACOCL|nr:hypothetical protein QJS10_CPA05g00391 [Acorus calamus]
MPLVLLNIESQPFITCGWIEARNRNPRSNCESNRVSRATETDAANGCPLVHLSYDDMQLVCNKTMDNP